MIDDEPTSSGPPAADPAALAEERAALLEHEIGEGRHDPESSNARRREIVGLYLDVLSDPVSAASHVEALLEADSIGADILDLAARVMKHDSVAARVAERISTAYQRLGRVASEANALAIEIDLAEPPRLDTAKRRLAELRAEELGDREGALAILEPMLFENAREAGLRAQYLQAAGTDTPPDRVVRTLKALLSSEKDRRAQAELARDLGRFCAERGDLEGARDAFLHGIRAGATDDNARACARALAETSREPEVLGTALAALVRLEEDPAERAAAVARLVDVQFDIVPALEQARRWPDLALVLDALVDHVADGDRASLLAQLAQVRLSHLEDAEGAIDALRQSLTADPRNGLGRTALEQLMARGDHRLEAAEILEPLYRAEGFDAGLLRALTTRVDVSPSPAERLALLGEALDIADRSRAGSARILGLLSRALREVVLHESRSVEKWLERVRRHAPDRAAAARVLVAALGDRALDRPELLRIGERTLEILLEAGDRRQAYAIGLRMLRGSGATLELCRRLDDLAGAEEPLGQRLERYQRVADGAATSDQRRSAMHVVARMYHDELHDLPRALEVWQKVLNEDPAHAEALQALVGIYERFDDPNALLAEVDNALALLEGPARLAMLVRKAIALTKVGQRDKAMEMLQELVDAPGLPDELLDRIATAAYDEDDPDLYRRALERLTRSTDEDVRTRALQNLGDFQYDRLGDRVAAIHSWKPAARVHSGDTKDEVRARELYERILDAAPEDTEAATGLVTIYTRAKEWARVPEVFAVLLRAGGLLDGTVELLLGLEQAATSACAVDEYVSMLDETIPRLGPEARQLSLRLMRAKARILTTDPGAENETSAAYRDLIEVFSNDRDVSAYEAFIESKGSARERHLDRRWIYAWKASHRPDPIALLKAWANEEEDAGELDGAVSVFERLLEIAPSHAEALERLARLKVSLGDIAGAVQALRRLRAVAPPDQTLALDLKTASLLLEPLGRHAEALEVVAPLLAASPPIAEAHEIARRALAGCSDVSSLVDVVEQVSRTSEDPRVAASTLELLVALPESENVTEDRRCDWYVRLATLREAEPDQAAAILSTGLERMPAAAPLWHALEWLAERLGRPEIVAHAFQTAMNKGGLDAGFVEVLGKRAVDFLDQWSSSAPELVPVLRSIIVRAPGATWALDRVKLLLSSRGEWEPLFELYDVVIEHAAPEARADLLDEAALAARDLAASPARAVGYLERVLEMRPEDASVRATLERLYDRLGHTRKLIALLEHRLPAQPGVTRRELLRRIATLWLAVGDLIEVERAAQRLLGDGTPIEDLSDLLERMLDAVAADDLGRDAQDRAFDALVAAYTRSSRGEDLVRLHKQNLARARSAERRARSVGELVRLHLAAASEDDRFARVGPRLAAEVQNDTALMTIAVSTFLEEATRAWQSRNASADSDAAQAAWWAIHVLKEHLARAGDPRGAADVLRRATELPFERVRRRTLMRDLAWLYLDRLKQRDDALAVLQAIFEEDAGDAIASGTVARYSDLLAGGGRHAEHAALWETVARARTDAGHAVDALDAWSRAAALWLEAADPERAIAAYTESAALGSPAALDALARLHLDRGDSRSAAEALELAFVRAAAPARCRYALELAALYDGLGEAGRSRARLEEALGGEPGATAVRDHLAAVYRAAGDSAALAGLLAAGASLREDPAERFAMLTEAAACYFTRLKDPVRAIALFEEALALRPDDAKLQATLADALLLAGRHAQAATIFRAQLSAFGDRRPKQRALVHHRLGRALLASGDSGAAFSELQAAAQLDPSDTEILYDVARLALDRGDTDLAEGTYRSLLLALHRARNTGPSRVAVYLDLSEIATRKGDAMRATDLIDSAFETASTTPEEAARLEAALAARGHHELLARAVERRLQAATDGSSMVKALADLAGLWDAHLGRPAEMSERLMLEADRAFEAVLRTETTDPETWDALVRTQRALGGDAAARAVVEKRAALLAHLSRPGEGNVDAALLRQAAALYRDLGDDERAAELYETLFEHDPLDVEALCAVREVLERLARYERLTALFEKAVRSVTAPADRIRLRLELAEALGPGQPELFMATLEQILADDPSHTAAMDRLAECYERAGRRSDLVALLRTRIEQAKAVKDLKNASALGLRLGATLSALGDPGATAVYESILDTAPEGRDLLELLAQRLDDLASARLPDALERLMSVEEPPARARIARRLVMLRTGKEDDGALERSLLAGFSVDAKGAFFRDRLIALYERQGRSAEALAVVARAAEADPKDDALLRTLARVCVRSDNTAQALGLLERAIAAHPASVDLLKARASVHATAGNTGAAVNDLERATENDPAVAEDLIALLSRTAEQDTAHDGGPFTLRLYDLLRQRDRTGEAREHLERYLAAHPSHVPALERLVDLATLEGNPTEVRAACNRLLPLIEGDEGATVRVALAIADACHREGKPTEAREALERAHRTKPDPEIRRRLVSVYEALGERSRLAVLLEQSAADASSDHTRAELLLDAATHYLHDGADPGAAIRVIERARELNGSAPDATLLLGRAFAARGDRSEALRVLSEVVREPRSASPALQADVHLEMARLHLLEDEIFEAHDALQNAFKIDRKNAEAGLLLGLVSIDLDDHPTAIRALRTVTAMGPLPSPRPKATAFYHLARLAHLGGDARKARLMATNALNEDPEHTEARALLDSLGAETP